MTRRTRTICIWAGVGLVSAVVAVYLTLVGLDEADRVASVVSLFVGLAGLGLAGVAAVSGPGGRRSAASTNGPEANGSAASRQEIHGGRFHGPVVVAGQITGDVLPGPAPATQPVDPARTATPPGAAPESGLSAAGPTEPP